MAELALSGKLVAVTGATSGIGAAIAAGAAREGAHVALCGRREAEGQAVARQIAEAGGDALFVACDVGDGNAVKAFIAEAVKRFGRLDAAVNCAGISCPDTKLADIEEDDFDTMMRINLRGVWLAMKYEIRQILAQSGGGAIVNMGSILGQVVMGAPAQYSAGHYVAAKHGVDGLTKAAAMDYGRSGIRVNSIAPGIVATAFSDHLIEQDVPVIRNFIAQTALGRLAKPEDIVGAAIYLMSDASRYVTGTTLVVDGGYLAQ
jgi:NAD(P)-dependent dehydrogenase (short-subunit alcohol dehydrogenase family)